MEYLERQVAYSAAVGMLKETARRAWPMWVGMLLVLVTWPLAIVGALVWSPWAVAYLIAVFIWKLSQIVRFAVEVVRTGRERKRAALGDAEVAQQRQYEAQAALDKIRTATGGKARRLTGRFWITQFVFIIPRGALAGIALAEWFPGPVVFAAVVFFACWPVVERMLCWERSLLNGWEIMLTPRPAGGLPTPEI